MLLRAVLALLLLSINACGRETVSRQAASPTLVLVDSLSLPGILDLADLAIASDGRIIVADKGDFSVKTFSSDGQLLKSFGRKGEGPGEFLSMQSVAVSGDIIAVSTRGGSVSLFRDGHFVSLLRNRVVALNSNMTFVGDSTVVVGGLNANLPQHEGGMIHLTRIDSSRWISFSEPHANSRAFEMDALSGTRVTWDGELVWGVQSFASELRAFRLDGAEVFRTTDSPEGFRTVAATMPGFSDRERFMEWQRSFDIPMSLFSLDGYLLLSVMRPQLNENTFTVHIFDVAARSWVGGIQTRSSIVAVDSNRNRVLVGGPSTEATDGNLYVYELRTGRQ